MKTPSFKPGDKVVVKSMLPHATLAQKDFIEKKLMAEEVVGTVLPSHPIMDALYPDCVSVDFGRAGTPSWSLHGKWWGYTGDFALVSSEPESQLPGEPIGTGDVVVWEKNGDWGMGVVQFRMGGTSVIYWVATSEHDYVSRLARPFRPDELTYIGEL